MNEIPRRDCADLHTPAEAAIRQAVVLVEAMGADVRLTDAVVLLARAQESVADFVDGVDRRPRAATAAPTTTVPAEARPTDPPVKAVSEVHGALRAMGEVLPRSAIVSVLAAAERLGYVRYTGDEQASHLELVRIVGETHVPLAVKDDPSGGFGAIQIGERVATTVIDRIEEAGFRVTKAERR